MPSRLAELLDDPNAAFEAAAARTAEGVRPHGGRKEGPATSALVNALSAVMHSTDPLFAASQERVMGGDYNPGPMVETVAGLAGGGVMRGAMRGTVGALGGAPGIRAYHGSPHDFDRFDMSKIGTGEGAQAYGHGLYFAQNEKVARDYKKKLSGIELVTEDTPAGKFVVKAFDGKKLLSQSEFDSLREAREWEKHMQATSDPGRMYEVNINARPEQLLDWEAPVGNNPQVAPLIEQAAKSFPGIRDNPDLTGAKFYQAYSQHRGGNRDTASAALKEAGIPGIKYLDQGSRGNLAAAEGELKNIQDAVRAVEQQTGSSQPMRLKQLQGDMERALKEVEALRNPSSNYVMFDDSLIDIMRKYGLAGAAPSAAVLAQALDQPQ
jgi:hypothetical protein